MGFILVTNDDGYGSPSLVPLIRALAALAPVRAVVPDRERSWIGKAITRWEDVRVERADREGCEIWRTSGSPADCTQLGVHALFESPPELVVSGINLGFNHGLAFFLSSGTVGGAVEGWIAGLPAIALSSGVLADHEGWAAEARLPAARAGWERAAALSAELVARVRQRGWPRGVDLLNVNFPFGAGPETPRELTELGRVGYDRVFYRAQPGPLLPTSSAAWCGGATRACAAPTWSPRSAAWSRSRPCGSPTPRESRAHDRAWLVGR